MNKAHHPVIVALLQEVPPVGSTWPPAQRSLWLQAAASVFDLVYGKSESVVEIAWPSDVLPELKPGRIEPPLLSPPPDHDVEASEEIADRPRRTRAAVTIAPRPLKPEGLDNLAAALEAIDKHGGQATATEILAHVREKYWPDASHGWTGCLYAFVGQDKLDRAGVNFVRFGADKPEIVVEAPKANGRPPVLPRPEGIPTNLDMALAAIEELGGRASALQILGYVRKKYWKEVPTHWTSSLHDNASKGYLARDGINFCLPAPPKPLSAAKPAASPVLDGVAFEHNGKKVLLHKREFRIAEALRRAMGKGHLDYTYLAKAGLANERVTGINEKNWCMEMVDILRPKLENLGLEVKHSPNFGYSMVAAD